MVPLLPLWSDPGVGGSVGPAPLCGSKRVAPRPHHRRSRGLLGFLRATHLVSLPLPNRRNERNDGKDLNDRSQGKAGGVHG